MSAERLPRAAGRVRVAVRYPVPARRVFDAWLEPAFAREWLFASALRPLAHVEIDARVTGRFCLVDRKGDNATVWRGEYVAIEPPRRLVFTLGLDGGDDVDATRVGVTFDDDGDRCTLLLEHDGVPAPRVHSLAERWIGILYGLGATLGVDADPTLLWEHER
jgi:uncharacterized protein YndB with AHSA1/START domain